MTTVEEVVEVAVPVRTAYNQWTQFKSFPRFMSAVKRVEQINPAVTRWVIGIGPLHREFKAEIVEQRPDSHLVWQSLERSPYHRGTVSFRSVAPDRTVMTVRIETTRRGLRDAVTNGLGVTRRVVRAELRNFKEYIEGLGEESGAWRASIHNGHVLPLEPEPPRSRVPRWPVG
ncbi:SRPBCC family protein [Actinacidiphila glaucinigra]|uniref:SRPBCC family protein n=1 Tax=Actinacidiphila glaucinigra TaxID=235986 RepID=UPI002DD92853|nr:SRPBCC family protein [Actinacidiphila glaucinigra]WSD57804.1 SRPBCC family protein [Actinacidiphila glaucinigra]